MHGMEETIRHGAEYTQWVDILSLFLSLPLSLSSSSVSSISIAAITMRVVMIVTLHQHGFPTRSILQKRQKLKEGLKARGGEKVPNPAPLWSLW